MLIPKRDKLKLMAQNLTEIDKHDVLILLKNWYAIPKLIKGLQSYQPSNFENDSTPRKLDWFEWARGQVAGFS